MSEEKETYTTSEITRDLYIADGVITDVERELRRQRDLYGIQRHDNGAWLSILIEEIGEAAQAMQQDSVAHKSTDADDLYTELVQSAAVAISWAACLQPSGRG